MATALHMVRLLIADLDETRQVLTDDHIGGFLALNGIPNPEVEDAALWGVRRAAADALDAIAVSENLVGKVIRTQDLSTDGAKVAAELRAQAANLRALAAAEEEAANDDTVDGGVFGVVEFHPWGH